MQVLIGLAVERRDLEAAREWCVKAMALCEQCDRPVQAARVRRHALVLGYAIGDIAQAESAISELAMADPVIARLGQLLLATTESDAAISAVLENAIDTGDSLLFGLAVLIGLRHHVGTGHREAAGALMEVGVGYLRSVAPHLVPILEHAVSCTAVP
jgi:hypothetical protein